MNDTFEIPEGLSERAKAFWKAHADAIPEPHRRELLRAACLALSRADAARAVIDREGLFVYHHCRDVPHAAVGVEAASIRLFVQLVGALGLGGI